MTIERALEALEEEITKLREKELIKVADFKTDVYNAIVKHINKQNEDIESQHRSLSHQIEKSRRLLLILELYGVTNFEIELHLNSRTLEMNVEECRTPTLKVNNEYLYPFRIPFGLSHNKKLWKQAANDSAQVENLILKDLKTA